MATKDGRVVGGRYKLLSLIGSGGMGAVYRAEHLILKREVALKLLHHHLRAHPRAAELRARFFREAESLARLDAQHPHIVSVADCGVDDDGTLYMSMELCQGQPLGQRIAEGPLPPAQAIHIAAQVLRALVHAHGRGVIHRDLKPDNIMLLRRDGRDDFVKVLDFGIAKLVSVTDEPADADAEQAEGAASTDTPAAPAEAALTRVGVIFGTPEYLAPEQARGIAIDARADLYAVGVILWEMLCGARPFQGETPFQTVSLQIDAEPAAPSTRAPGVPDSLDEVVLRAMAKDPADRYASAEDFLRALDGALLSLSGRRGRGVNPSGGTGMIALPSPPGEAASPAAGPATAAPVPVPAESGEAGSRRASTGRGGRPAPRPGARARRYLTEQARRAFSVVARALGVRGTAALVIVLVVLWTAALVYGARAFVAWARSRQAPTPASTPTPPPKAPPDAASPVDLAPASLATAPSAAPADLASAPRPADLAPSPALPATPSPGPAPPTPPRPPGPPGPPSSALTGLLQRLDRGKTCGERRGALMALRRLPGVGENPAARQQAMAALLRARGRANNQCLRKDAEFLLQRLRTR